MVITLLVSAFVMGGLTVGTILGSFVISFLADNGAIRTPVLFALVIVGGLAGLRGGIWSARRIAGTASHGSAVLIPMVLGVVGLASAAAVATFAPGFVMPILVLLPGVGAALGDALMTRRGRRAGQAGESFTKRG